MKMDVSSFTISIHLQNWLFGVPGIFPTLDTKIDPNKLKQPTTRSIQKIFPPFLD